MAITTVDDLRQHLQWAIALEHSTLPPYLCALYSIKPGHNPEAVAAITSVLIEEMLHMTLAANVLNAVGGAPVVDSPDLLPRYPTYLPHSANAFLVPLARFSPATIETFMKIEKPEEPDAPVESDRFHTIGQFYRGIEDALQTLCATLGEPQLFCGDPARQVTPAMLEYRGSGRIVAVRDLASALAAIDEIEEQGEGLKHGEVWDGDRDMFHPELDEVAHYFRYEELVRGQFYRRGDTPASGPTGDRFVVNWDAVYPMRDNPREGDFAAGSRERTAIRAFNASYCDLLRALHRAFNGEPAQLFATMPAMLDLKSRARDLLQMPSGDGVTTIGPSFEYVAPPATIDPGPRAFRITVTRNGPYVVEGDLPLVRKSIVYSEWHEPLTWRKDATIPTHGSYRLCRCGQSGHKPFCDGTHARVAFDGSEAAPTEPSAGRRLLARGAHIVVSDDRPLCTHAGFCGNRVEKVWDMLPRTDDSRVRFQVMQMVERCPSGRLAYAVDAGEVEPDLPVAIAATKDGPYWVTGGVAVTRSDGQPLEVRNRVTLCRCGRSAQKPLCDGTHRAAEFKDG
jgi:CDGSH-type Zn-finger protein